MVLSDAGLPAPIFEALRRPSTGTMQPSTHSSQGSPAWASDCVPADMDSSGGMGQALDLNLNLAGRDRDMQGSQTWEGEL